MRTIQRAACALILLSLAPAGGAGEPEPMWQRFYAVLASVVRGGSKDVNLMVCLEVPGITLSPLNSKVPEDVLYVNRLLDQTAAFNPVHTRGKVPFSKLYDEIMAFHRADPPVQLTLAQKAEYDRAVDFTRPDGRSMKLYEKLQDEFDLEATKQEAERWLNHAHGKGLTASPTTNTRVIRAATAWTMQGKRQEIEVALGTSRKYSNVDPAAWWYQRNADFQNAALMGSYIVSTFPSMDQWTSDDGWMVFSFKASGRKHDSDLNPTDVKAAAFLKFGGGHAAQRMQALAADKSLEITMKIKKVIINRPWVDWQVFTSNQWTWDRGVVSDGKGGGRLPLYTTAFVIARDVTFKARAITPAFRHAYQKDLKAEGKPSFGPFALREETGGKPAAAQKAQNEITIRDPQIVAFVCSIVPKCPAKTVK